MLASLVVVLAVANYMTFAWGVFGVFERRGTSGPGLTVIKIAAPLAALAFVVGLLKPGAITPIRGGLALAMLAGSLSLFWWSTITNRAASLSLAYCDDAPVHLVREGPYRFVRHPFYTAYLSSYLAAVVATTNPWLVPVLLLMTGVYYHAARFEERKFEGSALRDEYRRYRAAVGMFHPRMGTMLARFQRVGGPPEDRPPLP